MIRIFLLLLLFNSKAKCQSTSIAIISDDKSLREISYIVPDARYIYNIKPEKVITPLPKSGKLIFPFSISEAGQTH